METRKVTIRFTSETYCEKCPFMSCREKSVEFHCGLYCKMLDFDVRFAVNQDKAWADERVMKVLRLCECKKHIRINI